MYILAISGKKQSGKSTLGEFIDLNSKAIFDKRVFVDQINMADALKEDVCINIFGLDKKLVYGSEEEKNQLTNYKWENMPHWEELKKNGFVPKNKFMTGREFMQHVGTEIFRRMNPDVWAIAAAKKIEKSQADIITSCDIRFPSEIKILRKIKNRKTITIRLTKNINNAKDEHDSETKLDINKYDWKNFNIIINNKDMTIQEKDACVLYALDRLKVISLNKDNVIFAPYFSDKLKKKVKINK